MFTPEKAARLRRFLGGLPQPTATRLAKAIEADRLTGGHGLPHELILDALRPALRVQAGRIPTPFRLFCRPFEDLLVDTRPKEKQKGRISRTSIIAVWRWLSETLISDETQLFTADVKQLVSQGRELEALARAGGYWTLASSRMRDAIASNPSAARVALGSETAVADAQEMALLLSAGREVLAIQELLPKLTPQLGDTALRGLRDIYDGLIATMPDAAPYVAVVAMHRLLHPWEALKLPQLITNQTQDTLISGTDMGLVGEVLFSDIERHGNAVRATRHPNFDTNELVDHLARFTELSSHIVREIEVRRGGTWGKRLLADRAAVGETMEGLMERAEKDILDAMPLQRSGSYAGGPLVADLSHPVDEQKAERARRYSALLAGSRHYAALGSFAAAFQRTMDAVSQHLRSYNEDLIREIRRAQVSGAPRGLDRQFELAVELTALIFSLEEAEHLQRRARAAQA